MNSKIFIVKLPCRFLFSISGIFSSLFFQTCFSFCKLLLGNVTSAIMDKDLQSYSIKCEPKISHVKYDIQKYTTT